MDDKDQLRARWKEMNGGRGVDEQIVDKWWRTIEDTYAEEHRKYHNLDHIASIFKYYDCHEADLKCPHAVALAIYFHDIVYDPKAHDNEEKSDGMFRSFCAEAQSEQLNEVSKKVSELILQTKTHSTEEHKSVNSNGQEDTHYFLDFDMSILGSDPDEYDEYSRKIRSEYDFLSEGTYKVLRSKVLTSFLLIPNIFATSTFREKLEKKARDNIQREIASLK
ncbi:Uncharacterised protein g9929 [Pycnogonum litorale]